VKTSELSDNRSSNFFLSPLTTSVNSQDEIYNSVYVCSQLTWLPTNNAY